MSFVWESENYGWILSLIGILLLFSFLYVLYAKIIKRTSGYILISVSFFGILLSFFLNLTPLFILVSVLTSVTLVISLFTNLGDLRKFLASPFKLGHIRNSKVGVEKIYNREELYKSIESTVLKLSKTRTGAIITFEKNTSLSDIIKNGVVIKGHVTSELLETIFYPGTRLHDGAVVIRDNQVIAANVFFTPTTKPFAGRYGSRHRAALGISEITDSLTVVVSEETGRISFAVNGELETVTPDNFYRVFENYMDGVKEE